MRQVNGWGFKRIVSGNDHNSYYHELFLRDYPQLCLKMKRIRKGDKISEAIDEKDENEKSNEGTEQNEEGGKTDNNHEGGNEGKEESEGEGSEGQNSLGAAKETGNNSAGASPEMGGDSSSNNNNQNEGTLNANPSALPGLATQFQNHQVSAPTGAGIGGLDQSALMKLQEALQGGAGSNLLQQQQPTQQQMPFGITGLNMGNLGNLGGALAAQLQQATQVSC